MIGSQRSAGGGWYVTLLLMAGLGCDDRPAYQPPPVLANGQTQLVAEKGRGTYKWTWNINGYFEATRPSVLTFLEDSDSSLAIDSLFGTEDQKAWQRPEWMSDSVYESFRLFTDPPSPRTALEIPLQTALTKYQFFLEPKGKTIYWLSDERIHYRPISAEDAGQTNRDPSTDSEKSLASPVAQPIGVFADLAQESVFVLGTKQIARVRLQDGTTLWTSPLPKPAIAWCRARDADTIAFVTEDFRWLLCNSEDGMLQECKDRLTTPEIAIDPAGTKLVGIQGQKLLEWYPEGGNKIAKKHQVQGIDLPKSRPSSSTDADAWIDHQHFAFRGQSEYENADVKYTFSHYLVSARMFVCAEGTRATYYAMIGQSLPASIYQGKVVLCDIVPNADFIAYSQPVVLEDASALEVQISEDGRILAWSTPRGLHVLERTPRSGCRIRDEIGRIASDLIRNLDWEQLERVADDIRDHDWPKDFACGESAYSAITITVAMLAHNAELQPDNLRAQGCVEAFKSWFESGSPFAKIVELELENRRANLARGTGTIQTVSEEDMERFLRHQERVAVLASELLKGERAPGRAYQIMLEHWKKEGNGFQKAEELLQQCLQKYPQFWDVHETMMPWLLPRWGGAPGQAQAYAEGVVGMYPKKFRDRIFGIIVYNFLYSWNFIGLRENEGFIKPNQFLVGLMAWCQSDVPPQGMVEIGVATANVTNNAPKAIDFLVDYSLRHYPLMRLPGVRKGLQERFDEGKAAMLRAQPATPNASPNDHRG